MKKTKTILIALAAFAATNIAQAQVVDFDIGDLVIGFTATGGQGASSTYLVALDQAYTYRDATGPIANITNIGQDLSFVFGGNWFERIDLQWGVFGGVRASGSAVQGDPNRTVYLSQARPSVATDAPLITGLNSTSVATTATAINGVQVTFDGSTIPVVSGTYTIVNPNGAIVPTSASNTLDENVPPGSGVNSWGGDIPGTTMQFFANGTFGNFGGSIGVVEGALDINRILRTTTGANPSAAGVGNGSYEGTIVIGSNGSVSYYAVPEPTSAALVGLGAVSLAFLRRKRNTNRS